MGQSLSKGAGDQHDYSQFSRPSSFRAESRLPTQIFHLYENLPMKLKIIIWERAFQPREVRIWGQWIPNYLPQSNNAPTSRYVIKSSIRNPAALSVNRETREIALQFYKTIQFRYLLTVPEKLALQQARHPDATSFRHSLRDICLASDSLAFFSAPIGYTLRVDLANEYAYRACVSYKRIGLNFSFPENFQILRLREPSHETDRVVTSSAWQTLRFRWHVVGHLRTPLVGTDCHEAVLRIRCEDNRHDLDEIISEGKTQTLLCRLCGKRLTVAL